MTKENDANLMTFGGHLEVLRRMLFRIIAVAGTLSVIVFTCKETIWRILLAQVNTALLHIHLLKMPLLYVGMIFILRNFMSI